MSAARPIDLDLSRIAHDLRGPLMPLRTAAWLLRNEQGESGRVGELADIVDRQSIRLARMMDELSDWGRATGSQVDLAPVPVDVALTMDLAIGGLPGCQVEPDVSEEAAAFPLHADQHRLVQMLHTLIEHAAHRDPGNHPLLDACVEQGWLKICIRDRGATLDATARVDLLSRPLPNPFDDGLGLRLLLARRIAEAHGGRLEVDEAIQDGLVLTCAFPPGN
jgi:signal transduction histidine kinase